MRTAEIAVAAIQFKSGRLIDSAQGIAAGSADQCVDIGEAAADHRVSAVEAIYAAQSRQGHRARAQSGKVKGIAAALPIEGTGQDCPGREDKAIRSSAAVKCGRGGMTNGKSITV